MLQTLSSFGVLGSLECTLAIDDPVIKAASVDVLGFFVEFSPSMVRDYMLQQQHKVDEVISDENTAALFTARALG